MHTHSLFADLHTVETVPAVARIQISTIRKCLLLVPHAHLAWVVNADAAAGLLLAPVCSTA